LSADFTYSDSKIVIQKGKFVNEKTNMDNHELFKYIAMRYNNETCLEILDKIVQLAYDINKNYSSILGNDIKIYGDDTKRKIKVICDKIYNKIKAIEGSTSWNKTILGKMASEAQKWLEGK
jgi:hypothetical protein